MKTVGVARTHLGAGYLLASSDGEIFGFGDARLFGSMGGLTLNQPVVGVATTSSGQGYWMVAGDGGVFTFGDAGFFGSMGGQPLNKPAVGMAPTPSGLGYWLAAADGGVFTFGNAGFFGGMAGQPLNKPVVGVAATPTGLGYWLAAADGGVFAFGDATFFGSLASQTLNKPVVGIAATPSGLGYWLTAGDGGVFAFGDAGFFGSLGSQPINEPVVGIAATPTGLGYWLAAHDGGVFTFGDAGFFGSDVVPPPQPWAIILCNLTDVPSGPASRDRYVNYFTGAGCGSGGAYDYWHDVSYGKGGLRGSRVFGSFDIGHMRAELNTFTSTAQRQQILTWGLQAAQTNHVDLTGFPHKIVILNVSADHGQASGGVVFAYEDTRDLEPTFMFHEMGHEFGAQHSFGEGATSCATGDSRPGAYCDTFDIMSAMNVLAFTDTEGRLSGPTLNAVSRERFGWLESTRVRNVGAFVKGETVMLAAVNRPDADGYLLTKFSAPGRVATQSVPSTYTIEFRERADWDFGLPDSHVIIHEIRPDGLVRLLTAFNGGRLDRDPNKEFVVPGLGFVVRFVSSDATTHTAKVRFSKLPPGGARSVRILQIDSNPPGPDLQAESLTIQNDSQAAVAMNEWTLRDAASHVFTFPAFTLEPGFSVTVWTKGGTNDAENLFWGRHAPVWNNTHDSAVLRNKTGTDVATFSY